jgi:hypothetical protein
MRHPFFHVGFVVSNLESAMAELTSVLGVGWRDPIDAELELQGRNGVDIVQVHAVYTAEGPPAIELFESIPGTVLAGKGKAIEFHHLGLWADDLEEASSNLDGHGWPCAGSVAQPDGKPSRFAMHETPHDFHVELLDLGFPRPLMADLMPPD